MRHMVCGGIKMFSKEEIRHVLSLPHPVAEVRKKQKRIYGLSFCFFIQHYLARVKKSSLLGKAGVIP